MPEVARERVDARDEVLLRVRFVDASRQADRALGIRVRVAAARHQTREFPRDHGRARHEGKDVVRPQGSAVARVERDVAQAEVCCIWRHKRAVRVRRGPVVRLARHAAEAATVGDVVQFRAGRRQRLRGDIRINAGPESLRVVREPHGQAVG